MSNALLSGVSGLQAHQKMLDVAGDNLANLNTFGFKGSRVTFAQLLSQTLQEATQPSAALGGTNPQQIGSGVKVAAIQRDMSQGNAVNTGQPLDMAVEGAGYFTLNDGQKDVFTRVGAFAVDGDYFLVDPGTGYRVQRIGSEGVTEGFQDAASDNIRIPYDMALTATPTENIDFTGNLSADVALPTTNQLRSGTLYTAGNSAAAKPTLLADLDQKAAALGDGTITISGWDRDGNAVSVPWAFAAATSTLGDLCAQVEAAFPGTTANVVSGEIRVSDNAAGYSQSDVYLAHTAGAGGLEFPPYFQVLSAGGQETKHTNVEVFDALGIGHVFSVSFVRTNTANVWDAVLTNMTGEGGIENLDLGGPNEQRGRRVQGITFAGDGTFAGLAAAGTPAFQVYFGTDPTTAGPIGLNLGTIGEVDGLTQFGGASTAAAAGQDGYPAGYLSSISTSREGVLVGMFTNGIRRNIAALKLATFQNAAGLSSIGNSYFSASANSGEPVPTRALAGGAGSVSGGSLEKSNVDVAQEFVGLIQAQNGFQANARTIRVTTDMLRELANLIR